VKKGVHVSIVPKIRDSNQSSRSTLSCSMGARRLEVVVVSGFGTVAWAARDVRLVGASTGSSANGSDPDAGQEVD
jgi:hypothetical protein